MTETKRSVDLVSPPIDLLNAQKEEVLYHLAGRVPTAVDEFADDCVQSKEDVERVLNSEYQKEVKVDNTGFLRLKHPAKKYVVSKAKPLIADGVSAHEKAKTVVTDKPAIAINHYQEAVRLLSAAENRIEAVGDVPDKLSARVDSIRETHDNTRKKTVAEILNHRKLLGDQHEDYGTAAMHDGEYAEAESEFTTAVTAFRDAKEAVETYNSHRLSSESDRLKTEKIDRRIEAIERKIRRARENARKSGKDTHTGSQSETPSEGSIESDHKSSSDSDIGGSHQPGQGNPAQQKEQLIEELRRLDEEWSAVDEKLIRSVSDYQMNVFEAIFGSLDAALTKAGLKGNDTTPSDTEETVTSDNSGEEESRRDALVKELRNLDEEWSRIDRKLLCSVSDYHPEDFEEVFDSFDAALVEAGVKTASEVGIDESTQKEVRHHGTPENERELELIDELKRLDQQWSDINRKLLYSVSDYHPDDFEEVFGGLDAALAAAGVRNEEEQGRVSTDSARTNESKKGPAPSNTDAENTETVRTVEKADLPDSVKSRAGKPAKEKRRRKLISELQDLDKKYSHIDREFIQQISYYQPSDFEEVFGSLDAALEKAEVQRVDDTNPELAATDLQNQETTGDIQRSNLVSELQRLDKDWSNVNQKLIHSVSEYHPDDFREEFGSLDIAFVAAGVKSTSEVNVDESDIFGSDETETEEGERKRELINELQRLDAKWSDIDRKLLYSVSDYHPDDFVETFGSLERALVKSGIKSVSETNLSLADVREGADRNVNKDKRSQSDEGSSSENITGSDSGKVVDRDDLIENIKKLDDGHGYPFTTTVRKESEYTPKQYYDEFGSWDEVLTAAGIDKEQRLIKDIERVADIVGGEPKWTEIVEHGSCSLSNYTDQFGSWSAALSEANIDLEAGSGDASTTNPNQAKSAKASPDSDSEKSPTDKERVSKSVQSTSTSTSEKNTGETRSVSRASLIEEVKTVIDNLGRPPTKNEAAEMGRYRIDRYERKFETWEGVLEEAGVEFPSEGDLLDELARLYRDTDEIPTKATVLEHGEYWPGIYEYRFGSVEEAVAECEFDERDRLLNAIASVGSTVAGQPQLAEFTNQTEFEPTIVYKHFRDWNQACRAAGITETSSSKQKPSSEQLIDDLKRVNLNIEGYPTTEDVRDDSDYEPAQYVDAFDSWEGALEAADIDKQQELLTVIKRVADDVDGRPTLSQMDEHSDYSMATFAQNFESWSDALDDAGVTEKETGPRAPSQPGDIQESINLPSSEETATFDSITDNSRIDEPMWVRVVKKTSAGDKKDVSLHIEDVDGDKGWLNIWTTHGIDVDWETDTWYRLKHARGKFWRSGEGEENRHLSSTSDLLVKRNSSNKGSNSSPEQENAVSRESDNEINDQDKVEQGQNNKESEDDGDGILGDVMGEFDDL